MSLSFDHTTLAQRVLFGSGSAVTNTTSAVTALGGERVLLVAGGSANALADQVAEKIAVAARIRDIVQHVPAENVAAARTLARDERIDAIVAIGGGSATGLAKAIALEIAVPIVAVPTTFAGSEATDVWGITDGKLKTTGTDPRVLPAVVVYDAELSVSLPARFAVSSGINAIAHAVDGFWAPHSDPINRALATESLQVLARSLPAMHANPDDLHARENLLYGAYLAGVAWASSRSGMHHKLCHVLGGTYNLSHADTHAVMLPYVAAFNISFAPDAAERISRAFGGAAETALFDFNATLGAPHSLAELGFVEDNINEAAEIALSYMPPTSPRPVTQDDLERILRAAWAGTRP